MATPIGYWAGAAVVVVGGAVVVEVVVDGVDLRRCATDFFASGAREDFVGLEEPVGEAMIAFAVRSVPAAWDVPDDNVASLRAAKLFDAVRMVTPVGPLGVADASRPTTATSTLVAIPSNAIRGIRRANLKPFRRDLK